jgi:hypothetical protein
MEVYKQYLSLRQLADQRRYREQQYRAQELLAQQREQEYQEGQNLRQLFAGPKTPTEQEVLAVSPKLGLPILREQRQAETARLQQQEQQRKVAQQFREQFINGLHAVANETDPQKRAGMYEHLQRTMRLTIGNFMTPDVDALISQPMPALDQLMTLYEAEFGPEKAQALRDKQAGATRAKAAETRAEAKHAQEITKGALDVSKAQLEQGLPLLEAATNQNQWTAALQSMPANIRPLIDPTFSPAAKERARNLGITAYQQAQLAQQAIPNTPDELIMWLNKPGRTPDEIAQGTQALAAMTKYHQDIRPTVVQDTSGLVSAIVKNPAIYQGLSADMKAQVAPQLTAQGFTEFDKPTNLAAFKTKSLSLQNLDDAINAYENELKMTGPTSLPWKSGKIKSLYTNLQMLTKSLFELGVITGPDMQILQGAISDPTEFRGNWLLGKEGLLEQLQVMKSVSKRTKNNLAEVYGQPLPEEKPPGQPPASGGKKDLTKVPTDELLRNLGVR